MSPTTRALPFPDVMDWMRQGIELAEQQVRGISDADLQTRSRLPGWTRAHVVAHLARNADGLVNLLTWARTGVQTPMYASRERRNADIEEYAAFPAGRLRAELAAAHARLAEAMAAMPESAWTVTVQNGRGELVPASQVPWMRTVEVWVHTVDLAAGAGFGDMPSALTEAVLDDAARGFAARTDCCAALLAATDQDRTWSIGPELSADTRTRVVVGGRAARLLGWLLGRDDGVALHATTPDGRPPRVPPWR